MKCLSTARVRWPKIVLKGVVPAICVTAFLLWSLPDLPAQAQTRIPAKDPRSLSGPPSPEQTPRAPGAMSQPQMGGSRTAPGAPPGQSPMGAASIGSGTMRPMPQAQPQVTPGGPGAMGQGGSGSLTTPPAGVQPSAAGQRQMTGMMDEALNKKKHEKMQPGAMGQPQMGGSRTAPGAPPGQSPMGAASIGSGTMQPRPMPQAQPQMTPGGPGAMGQAPMGRPGMGAGPQRQPGSPGGGMAPSSARRPTQ